VAKILASVFQKLKKIITMIERYCDLTGEKAVNDLGKATRTTLDPVWASKDLRDARTGLIISLWIGCEDHPSERKGPPDLSKRALLNLMEALKEHIESYEE